MTQVVALVVHAKEHIIILPIESLVTLRTFQCPKIILLLLLLLNPDEVEADLLPSQLLTTSLALHHLNIQHLVAITAVLAALTATAVGASLAPLGRLNDLVVVIAVISSSSKHIRLLLLPITRSRGIRVLLLAALSSLTVDGSEALVAHDHLLFVTSTG